MSKYLALFLLLACNHQNITPTAPTTLPPTQAETLPVDSKTKSFSMQWVPTNPTVPGYPVCNTEDLGYVFGTPAYLTTGLDPLGVVDWQLTTEGDVYPHTTHYAKLEDGREISRSEHFSFNEGLPAYNFNLSFQSVVSGTHMHLTNVSVLVGGLPEGKTFGLVFIHHSILDNVCLEKEGSAETCLTQAKCVHEFQVPDFSF